MTAHVLFPRLDDKRPATLSPNVMQILRGELGYDGLVFSDDIEMRAMADHWSSHACSIGVIEAASTRSWSARRPTCATRCWRIWRRRPTRCSKRRAADAGLQGCSRGRAAASIDPPYAQHVALADALATTSRDLPADPTERA